MRKFQSSFRMHGPRFPEKVRRESGLMEPDDTRVFDAVFHTTVIQECQDNPVYKKAISDLAFGCIKELHQIEIVETVESEKAKYFGPYAWGSICLLTISNNHR